MQQLLLGKGCTIRKGPRQPPLFPATLASPSHLIPCQCVPNPLGISQFGLLGGHHLELPFPPRRPRVLRYG